MEQIAKYLDNGELLDVVAWLDYLLTGRADQLDDLRFYDAALTIQKTLLEVRRSSWSADEELYLNSCIASQAGRAHQRTISTKKAPYADLSSGILAEMMDVLSLKDKAISLVMMKTLVNLGIAIAEQRSRHGYERSIDALRVCTGPDTDRFPRHQQYAKTVFVTTLNNCAVDLDSFDAADEALRVAVTLTAGDLYVDYITGFAAWQRGRLMASTDAVAAIDCGRQAKTTAERALTAAAAEDNRVMISRLHELLRAIDRSFPTLVSDMDARSGKEPR